jgi:hypothetical protein
LFNKVIDEIEHGKVPADQFRNVQYLDFVSNQMGTVETVYREMGVDLSDRSKQCMAKYIREHPRESRPVYKYSTENARGHADERKLFERYQSFFNVKTEI